MSPAKIVSTIIGVLLALVAISLIASGVFLLWGYGTQRDSSGFFQTSSESATSPGYALTSPDVDVHADADVPGWLPKGTMGTARLEAQAAANESLFVGIGPTDQVSQYLGGVAYDEITDVGTFGQDLEYRRVEGGAPPSVPSEQDFWVAQSEGTGAQSVEWDVQGGNWTAVIMNSDAGSGVDAEISVGGRFDLLLPITIGLLIAGFVLAVIALVLVILGLRRSHPAMTPPLPPVPPQAPVPPTV